MSAAESARLMQAVHDKLHITYDDEMTERRLQTIVEDSEAYLTQAFGIPTAASFDFAAASAERSMLLDMCFYAYNDATDDFIENYASAIEQIRQKWRRWSYAQAQTAE